MVKMGRFILILNQNQRSGLMNTKQDPYDLLRFCATLLKVPTQSKKEEVDAAYRKLLKEFPYEPKGYKELYRAYVTLISCFDVCEVCGGSGSFFYMMCPPCKGTGKTPKQGYVDALK